MSFSTRTLAFVLTLSLSEVAFAEVEVEHGDLKITLPSSPMRKTVTIEGLNGAEAKQQHQLIINQPNGSIIVWHQEAAGITDPKQALTAAHDSIVKIAGGTVSVDKEFVMQGHPGRYFIVSIPQMDGEFRVAYLFANRRFYQILAVGTQEFTRSEATNKMFETATITDDSQ